MSEALVVLAVVGAVVVLCCAGWVFAVGMDGVFRRVVGEPVVTLKVSQNGPGRDVVAEGTVSSRGKPASGAQVWLTRRCDADVEGVWRSVATVTCGYDGAFRITFPPGHACRGEWQAGHSRRSLMSDLEGRAHVRFEPA